MVITTGDKKRVGSMPTVHPKINEQIVINEILGEYLRFDQYDCDDVSHPDYGWRWWKHTHFSAIKESNASIVRMGRERQLDLNIT